MAVDSGLSEAVAALAGGGLIACPTEGVYGLSCDPRFDSALERLVRLKRRRLEAGFILIAADEGQLLPWIFWSASLDAPRAAKIRASWPGPVTWAMPVRPGSSKLVTGGRDTIAVRVTAHPRASELCRLYGAPLISTSANLSGEEACVSGVQTRNLFPHQLDGVLEGDVGGLEGPTPLYNAIDGIRLR